jgi:peptide/nickel transport system substrate-binding protein
MTRSSRHIRTAPRPLRTKLRAPRARTVTITLALALGLALGLAAVGCSSPSPQSGGHPVKGGTASFYEITGDQPNWIFPFDSPAYSTTSDITDFQMLMYRPLYWFGGENTSPTLDPALSVAAQPAYTDGGKTVVINLKGWKWSDGEIVNAADVVFWLHMMEAESQNWFAFVPGGIPDNIASITASGPLQVTLRLNRAYSSLWYTYNELSQITPMPQAWDVIKAGAAPGSGGCTTDSAADHWARCVAVYNFLDTQAKDSPGYAGSPIWSIVDGPWRLKTFNTAGNDAFVPNPEYSGSPKPAATATRPRGLRPACRPTSGCRRPSRAPARTRSASARRPDCWPVTAGRRSAA